jgi:hypothetical protein
MVTQWTSSMLFQGCYHGDYHCYYHSQSIYPQLSLLLHSASTWQSALVLRLFLLALQETDAPGPSTKKVMYHHVLYKCTVLYINTITQHKYNKTHWAKNKSINHIHQGPLALLAPSWRVR